MVSTGFHIVIGIVLANRLFQTRPYAKLALIIVSALPDIDLLGSLVIYLLTQNETATVGFHRTLTHSPIVFSAIFLGGCFLFLIDHAFFDSSKPWILEVTIGLMIGLLVHVGIDLIYFSGVALLWPFSQEHYALFPYSYENFSHEVQKVLSTLDFFVDVGLYLIVYAMAIENQTDLKRLKILKWLRWIYGGWVLIFLGLAFFPIERNLYVILQYGLGGLIFLTFTMFLPALMKETMVAQSDLPVYFNLEKIIFITVIWAILAIPLSILPNVDFLLVAIFWIGVMVIQFLIFIPAFEMLYRQRNKPMNSLKGIIFDFDDTLIYSNIPWSEIKDKAKVIMAKAGILVENLREYSMTELFEMVKVNSESVLKDLWTLVEEYEDKCALTAKMDPETPEILKKLAQKFQLGILTNNAARNTYAILERFNIAENFQIVLTREDLPRSKPEPDGLLISIERLRLTKEECVYVGDSWVDAQTAARAEVRFIRLNLDNKERTMNYPCWKSIIHLRELLKLLKS